MDLYTDKDLIVFNERIPDIMEKLKNIQLDTFEPKRDEINNVTKIILKFIKEKKRKIYGGYALNMILKDKNKNDAIYSSTDLPDIDFYSPEPIKDLIELCNILHDANFKSVEGKEALHGETYKMFVNGHDYVDISYVPRNIYNRMPFLTITNLNVIHPHFMAIDYFRMFTDPMSSYWRIEKSLPRFKKLLKHYPLRKMDKKLNLIDKVLNEDVLKRMLTIIKSFLGDNKSVLLFGYSAYNYYLKHSNIKKFDKITVPYYEIISSDYVEDVKKIKKILCDNFKDCENDITMQEFYPFFQLYGYNVTIYYKSKPLIRIFESNNRCTPYIKHKDTNKKEYLYGNFDTVLMMNLIFTIHARTIKDTNRMIMHQIMTSDLIQMRNFYLTKNKKSFMDESPFQAFTLDCIGSVVTLSEMMKKKIEKRKKEKKPYIWKYTPANGKQKPDDVNYIFSNTSGNIVNNIKNLKIK